MGTSILVLGGDGMLGHKMFQTLRQGFADTCCTIRGHVNDERHSRIDLFQQGGVLEAVDVTDMEPFEQLLRDRRPHVVVNCVGIIKQRSDAHAAVPSITVNALLPHRLARALEEWGGRLLHFSTDCVFNGSRGHYSENDTPDATDLYGRSKLLGEVTTPNALTLRTSIIGRELGQFASLLEWFLAQRGGTVKGFTRATYSGVTTNHLAQLAVQLIMNHPKLSGLYQVASQPISKNDLLHLLRGAYGLDVKIVPDNTFFCDRSMMGDKFHLATGCSCPSWSELVAEMASDQTPYDAWRQ